jgi:hypothetical protein
VFGRSKHVGQLFGQADRDIPAGSHPRPTTRWLEDGAVRRSRRRARSHGLNDQMGGWFARLLFIFVAPPR